MVDASLPILILGSPKVKIGALKDFDPDKQVSTRGRTLTTDTPITPMKPSIPCVSGTFGPTFSTKHSGNPL